MERHLRAAVRRRRREDQERRWAIWHVVALDRQKKLPTFTEFVRPPQVERRGSLAEQMRLTAKKLIAKP